MVSRSWSKHDGTLSEIALTGLDLSHVERIDDPSDPRLADYRDFKDPELRRHRGLFVAESREVVRRLLDGSRFRTRSVLLTPGAFDALQGILETSGVHVF